MTLRIVDVSKYQVERPDALDLAKAKAAGVNVVNVALDLGKASDALPGWARSYVEGARSLDMGVCVYRWLDARLTGAAHAARILERMRALGGPDGMALSVDCEDNATWPILRDCVNAVQDALQRHVFLYTADWWWDTPGRRWDGASLTPYLWAAPNNGYLSAYPGDESPHWTAGYGGWGSLAAMQYAVAPLPDTGKCSLSAVRDDSVWIATTGGTMRSANMQVLTDQVKAKYPGVVVYGIGDAAHKLSPSGHNEDDTPGSKPEDEDADSRPEHRAIDVMIGKAFTSAQAAALVVALVTLPANQRRLLYVIYARHIWRAKGGWKQENYTGSDTHDNHVHVSGEADDDENTAPWIIDRQGDNDVKTICYDGKGYAIGDGVRRRTFIKWEDVLETQAMGRDGRLQLTGNGTIYPIVNFDNLGELENPGVDGLRESLDALALRLAEADNDLPADAGVIKDAVEQGIEEYAERILSALAHK